MFFLRKDIFCSFYLSRRTARRYGEMKYLWRYAMGRFDSIDAAWDLWEESCLKNLKKMGWVLVGQKWEGWTMVHPEGLERNGAFYPFLKRQPRPGQHGML
jgi:hypothetical protein